MSPEQFIKEWQVVALQDKPSEPVFRKVELKELQLLPLSEETRNFLITGVPEEPAAYRFDLFPPLRRVYEVFAPSEWTQSQKEEVQPYWVLGEDGGGNAICLHEAEGTIWLLDHEKIFHSREFINSSLKQFLEFSLLSLRAWVGEVTYSELLEPMRQIDPVAMAPEHTWLQIMIEEEQKS